MGRKLGRRMAETLVVKLMAGCSKAGPIMPKVFLATTKQKQPPEGRPPLFRIH